MVSKIKLKKINQDIASVVIDDPQTYNSLSTNNLNDLIKIFKKLDNDKKIKVIIIEGSGNGFSAGHNLKEVRNLKKRDKYQKLFKLCSKLMLQIVEGKKPVIAKVHGAAYAAGCQLVASCDLAIATQESKFATPGVNIGLFCSTPMVALSRNVGRKDAMQMLLTGDLISAKKAKKIGLINDVIGKNELDEAVKDLSAKIASKSSMTIKTGKKAFYVQAEMDLSKAYAYTSKVMAENLLNEDAKEGIDAFINKRSPDWKDE